MYTRTRINLVNKPCRNDVKFHPKWLWHSVRFKMINHSVLLMSQLYVVNKQISAVDHLRITHFSKVTFLIQILLHIFKGTFPIHPFINNKNECPKSD